jgi:type IV secretion system protein VirB8
MNAITGRAAPEAAFRARAVPDDPQLLTAYFRQVASYEADRLRTARRSARLAWTVAAGATGLAAAACLAIAALTPLKTIIPFVFRVDNATGIVERVYDVQGGEMEASDAMRRFYLWQYVRYRQGYVAVEAQQNFDAVNLMSTAEVQQSYADWFRGSNPTSPQVTLGRTGIATVNWVSTSLLGPNLAQVRFTQTERKGDQVLPTKHLIATIGFDFAHGAVAGSAINVNPNGFLVTSYHVDQEATP